MLKDFRKGVEKLFENQNLIAFNIGLSCKSPHDFNSSNASVIKDIKYYEKIVNYLNEISF